MKARDNPLRSERVERLLPFQPQWLGTDWDEIMDRLRRLSWRGAVVGPHGSGKSTMLRGLAERLRQLGDWPPAHSLQLGAEPERRLARDQLAALLAAARRGEFLMIDGAEQIGPFTWCRIRRAARSAVGLVITSHRRGRLPLLLATSTSPVTLERCLQRLLPGEPPPFSPEQVRELWRRHRGNVREALWEAYNRIA